MLWRWTPVACVLVVVVDEAAALVRGDVGGLVPFTQEAAARGLNYQVRALSPFESPTNGQGIALVDLNGNGHLDIVVMGEEGGRVGFFENDGTGIYTDRSFVSVKGNLVAKFIAPLGSGIAAADYNGDGLVDIYITQLGNLPNMLLRNEGNFNFTDVALTSNVANVGLGYAAIWGDYDNDGWLDLYVVNYTLPSLSGNPTYRNKLFRNRGDGTFSDVSVGNNVDDPGAGLAAVFSDLNRDGWLDLYLANDKGHQPPMYNGNKSWRNNDGQFENTCETSGLCLGFWAMCAAAGDVTGNGFPDLYVTNLPHPAGYNGWNPLFVNNGDDTFSEQCTEANVCQFVFSWSAMFFDYDNNGWLDLYVCNQTQANRLYANAGTFPLINVAPAANAIGSTGHTYNAAVGDVTGDGTIDIVLNDYGVNNTPQNVWLLVNHEGATRNWVRFRLVGIGGNLHAIGSNIELSAGGHTQWRELYAGGNNYKSQNETVYHFGLGSASSAEEIVVNWPGGKLTRTLTNYPAGNTWTIYPPEQLGDANGDGIVDLTDLLAMLAAWGPVQPGSEMLDINGDGVVDAPDLSGLLELWGERLY